MCFLCLIFLPVTPDTFAAIPHISGSFLLFNIDFTMKVYIIEIHIKYIYYNYRLYIIRKEIP